MQPLQLLTISQIIYEIIHHVISCCRSDSSCEDQSWKDDCRSQKGMETRAGAAQTCTGENWQTAGLITLHYTFLMRLSHGPFIHMVPFSAWGIWYYVNNEVSIKGGRGVQPKSWINLWPVGVYIFTLVMIELIDVTTLCNHLVVMDSKIGSIRLPEKCHGLDWTEYILLWVKYAHLKFGDH